jgi:hypothetical protein
LALVACGPGPVDEPSWQQDIAPLLAASCVRCHGHPALGGAPPEFRLDSYDDVVLVDGTALGGAASWAVIAGNQVNAGTMPPRFPLEDHQVETFDNWIALAPVQFDPPPRGQARANNRLPSIEVTVGGWQGTSVELVVDLHDPDGDLVVGALSAQLAAETPVPVLDLASGRRRGDWDTTGLLPGTYQLSATVDDGAGWQTIAAGSVEVTTALPGATR